MKFEYILLMLIVIKSFLAGTYYFFTYAHKYFVHIYLNINCYLGNYMGSFGFSYKEVVE